LKEAFKTNGVERGTNLQEQFPTDVEECIQKGAARLGEALNCLNWPNGGKEAPCHEVNALVNISFYLGNLLKPYYVYAEACVAQRGRVDMVGCNGETAIAFEAKGFGRIHEKSKEILNDLRRLKTFRPSLTDLAGNQKAPHWWDEAKSRWVVIVISSFRGQAVRDAWLAEDENIVKEKLLTYSKGKTLRPIDDSGFMALHRDIPASCRHAALITDASRWGSAEGWLLWAAVRLP
jgi:hypothetical protein